MMPLMTTAIVAFCVNYQGQYNEACNKALDAGTRQVGIRQNLDLAESKANEVANQKAEFYLGKERIAAIGSGLYVFKVVKEKSVSFRLPTRGVCNSLTSHVAVGVYDLTAEWKF